MQKAREDALRLAFARGLGRDVLRARQSADHDVRDLVRRFVGFLVANEEYVMRQCWSNRHLCRSYRAVGAVLARWCAQTSGCAEEARVLEDEVLASVLGLHKDAMDDETKVRGDYEAVRDDMRASFARMQRWIGPKRTR